MQKIEIQGTYRKEAGKGVARKLRARGHIPAVLYRKGASAPLALNPKAMVPILRSTSARNSLITLSMVREDTSDTRLAILKEIQRNSLTGEILHVDFLEVAMDEAIRVQVPVETTGTAVGVKAGGILQHGLRELGIQALPSVIPDKISVDVSALEIGQAIHVRDIIFGEGIRGMTPPDYVVVSVVPPISEAKMEAILATGPKETKEPEVVGRKEKEEGEGEVKEDAGKAKAKEDAGKAKDKGKK